MRLSSPLRDLRHAEVLSWDLGQVEHQVSEAGGPVEVWYHGVVVGTFPFFAAWVIDGRTCTLYVYDPIARRKLGEYERGRWEEIGRGLHRPVVLAGAR